MVKTRAAAAGEKGKIVAGNAFAKLTNKAIKKNVKKTTPINPVQ
jgi:hypothetical protein